MTGSEVLEAFAAVGVSLREDAGQVVYRAPFGKVSPALRDALRDHEAEVLGLLSGLERNGTTTPADVDSARLVVAHADAKTAHDGTNTATGIPLAIPQAAGIGDSPAESIPTAGVETGRKKSEADLPAIPRHLPGTCYTCGGAEFWRSRWVERICCKCHPQLGTPERREAYEERAAILEHDAKLTRPEAERLAKEMIR